MSEEKQLYISYLLRLWQIESQRKSIWRTSLESPHTGERRGFAHLEELFHYLRIETGAASVSERDGERVENDANSPKTD